MRVVPADFWYLTRSWVRWIPDRIKELKVLHSSIDSTWQGEPEIISYEAQRSAFRVNPIPSDGMAAPEVQVEGIYKKQPTQITPATVMNVLAKPS